jgi:hypothetical protein
VLEQAVIVIDNGEKFIRSKSISIYGGRNYSSISHNADDFRHLMELGGNQELQGIRGRFQNRFEFKVDACWRAFI